MAAPSQIITDLEALGATPKVIGYFTALTTFGYMSTPSIETVDFDPGEQPKARAPRNRISKAGQKILDCLVPEGMPKREIGKATGLTPAQMLAGINSLERAKLITVKNGRYYTAQAAAASPPGGARKRSSSAAATGMGAACLTALQELSPGATNEQVREYAAKALNMPIRPNHVGIALTRHQRAGRAEKRNELWYLPEKAESRQAA